VADQDDILNRLERLARRMSEIPGDARWVDKGRLLVQRQLTKEEERYLDKAEAAWRFEQEKIGIAQKQGAAPMGFALPLICLTSTGAGVWAFFVGLLVITWGAVAVVLVSALVWRYYRTHTQTSSNRFNNLANLPKTGGFPWE
jgi:Flp pilus assembly protein TadB